MLSCMSVYGKCEAGDIAAHMEMITEIIKRMTLPRNKRVIKGGKEAWRMSRST